MLLKSDPVETLNLVHSEDLVKLLLSQLDKIDPDEVDTNVN